MSRYSADIHAKIIFLSRFAKKTFKQSREGRYWKKFRSVLMERDPSGIQYADVCFCPDGALNPVQKDRNASRMLATAISARVDIYNLHMVPEDAGEEELMKLSPTS